MSKTAKIIIFLLLLPFCPVIKGEINIEIKNTNFRVFSDNRQEVDITVSNRKNRRAEINIVWQGGVLTRTSGLLAVRDKGARKVILPADGEESVPILFESPPVKICMQYLLQVEAISGEDAVKRNFVFDIYPPADFSRFRKKEYSKKIGVYNPDTMLAGIIEKEGLPFTRIESLRQLNDFNGETILAGWDMFKDRENSAFSIITSKIADGKKVLFLTQQPVCIEILEEKGFSIRGIKRFGYVIPDLSTDLKTGLDEEKQYYINPLADGVFIYAEQGGHNNIALEIVSCTKGWFAFSRRLLLEQYEKDPLMPHVLKNILNMLDDL